MAAKSKPKSDKILRACVVQGGKVIEEQRLKSRQDLSVGKGPKNTFVIADGALPKTHQLFVCKGSQYELIFTESMRGKVSAGVGGKPVDFASLKAQGLVKKKGNRYHLPLTEDHRGKVIVGDATIIFQFVVPPPAPERVRLPAAARGTIWQSMDWPYVATIAIVFLLESPLIVALHFVDQPEPIRLEALDDRWADLVFNEPPEKPKPEKPKNKGNDGRGKKVKKAKPKVKEEPVEEKRVAVKRPARSAGIRDKVKSKGILALLGSTGDSAGVSGAVGAIFSDSSVGGDLDAAFEGMGGVGLAVTSRGHKRGGASGSAASIGGLATSGGGKVGLGGKSERRVGTVKPSAPEVDGSLDPKAVASYVKRRLRSITDCYNRELKRNPNLSGKIEIEFTIAESGRVESTDVVANKMGSAAVAKCIMGRISRWRFPKPDGGSVTVSYPFIFTPGS